MSQDEAFQSLEMPPMASTMSGKARKLGEKEGKQRDFSMLQNNQIINNNQVGGESPS